MQKILKVEGMSCQHCIKHITEAVNEIEGAQCLEVSLDNNNAIIEVENDEVLKNVKDAINEAGYEVAE